MARAGMKTSITESTRSGFRSQAQLALRSPLMA